MSWVVAGAPRRLAGADPAELDRAVCALGRVLQLAEPPALVERIDREDVGAAEQLGIELLLARAVGPHRRDVRARRDPIRRDQRLARRRAR